MFEGISQRWRFSLPYPIDLFMIVPKISAQLLSQSLLSGTLAILSIGNAIASEIPTVQVSAVDRQSELLEESTDDSIAKIGGIYPINTLLNPESAPATSDLALARRKKRINTKPQIKRGGINTQPQIQNTPINTSPQIQNTPINTSPQVQNTPINPQPQVQNPQINTPPPMPSGLTATQNQIQYKRNDLGVAVQFGNGTSIGIQGKFGLTDNISIRPEFFFNGGNDEKINQIPLFLTSPAGVEKNSFPDFPSLLYPISGPSIVTQDFTLNGSIKLGSSFTTPVAIGDFAAGTVIPENTLIPPNTTLKAGTYIPEGTSILAFRNAAQPELLIVPVDFIIVKVPSVLATDYKISLPFTASAAIGKFPAGTVIPVGTILPAGTIIPLDTQFPIDTRTSNTIPLVVTPIEAASKIKTTGTSYGLAITYDFKLDPTGKSTAYLGPKVSFTSATGSLNLPGATKPITVNTNETKIGLVAGLDYVVFDGFTIGANATYNISRNTNGSISFDGSIPFNSTGGSSTDFGLRIGYQF